MLRYWGTLVFLLLATPMLVAAQNTGKLSGRVLDASTGEPLPGANVILLETQLGTITDVDGNYFILGVPVGTYNVQSSYVGYQAQTTTGVEINAGYTRELNFSLAPGVELNEIVVEYERPLIQKDAIGAPRVVTADEIVNLPIRGVANIAALQSGVVANEGSGSLFVRGGRSEEVAYYVDGVKVVGALAVPQQSIQEQEMLIGAIPARYGDAMSGIISVTTKTGGSQRFFGTIEALSSQVLDPFGYNLGSISVGGPIAGNKISFFISGEGVMQEDSSPYARPVLQLGDEAYSQLWNAPQVVEVVGNDGELSYLPFPTDIRSGFTTAQLDSVLTAGGMIGGQTGLHLSDNHVPRFATDLINSEDQFSAKSSKKNPYQRVSLNGNVTINPVQSVNLRLGGAFDNNQEDTYNYTRSLYNRDRYYNNDRQTWRGFGTWRHRLGAASFYEVGVNFSDYRGVDYPNGFSKDVDDALYYGDADGVILDANGAEIGRTPAYDVNSVVRRYWQFNTTTNRYLPQYTDGSFPSGAGAYNLFASPGSLLGTFDKFHTQSFRLNASATTQIGLHQIEFGGEYEQRTSRRYRIAAGSLSRYFSDGKQEIATDKPVNSWADMPFSPVESAITSGFWYGYDYLGRNEVNEDDLAGYAEYNYNGGALGANTLNIAPHKPIYYAGYVQDKIEFRDLIINLGMRVDVFDNNTQVLRDPYAALPIYRAADVSVQNLPSNIGDDFAVYFPDANPANTPVGYRDTEGNFYDATGQRSSFDDIGKIGKTAENKSASFVSIFKDYKPQVTLMPRIGVSFPVTDQALFFASYNVLTQRPSEQAFLPAQAYVKLGNEYIANPNLKPETTTQYELGFRQRLGSRAALQLSGFYRTQNNKIQIRSLPSGLPVHNSYYNVDFTTTKGATVEFDLRRTSNLAMNANYTLQFAQGTGSDSGTMQTIAWRGDYFPNFIAPTDFDRRHTFNVRLDYRLGAGEGPEILGTRLLENFGVNVVGSLKSGMPYTQLRTPLTYPIFQNVTDPAQGGLNSVNMPWTSLVDLNVDRRFALGGRTSLTAFLQVQNLFDVDNILGVYRGTGLADDDGFLDTQTGRDLMASSFDPQAFAFHYRTFLRNPIGPAEDDFAGDRAYGLPRRTRLGLRFNF